MFQPPAFLMCALPFSSPQFPCRSFSFFYSSLMSPTPSIRNRPLMVAFISMARPFYCSRHPDVPEVCTVIALQVGGALHAPFSKNWTSMDQYPFGSTLNFCAIVSFSRVHAFTHSALSFDYQLFRRSKWVIPSIQ